MSLSLAEYITRLKVIKRPKMIRIRPIKIIAILIMVGILMKNALAGLFIISLKIVNLEK